LRERDRQRVAADGNPGDVCGLSCTVGRDADDVGGEVRAGWIVELRRQRTLDRMSESLGRHDLWNELPRRRKAAGLSRDAGEKRKPRRMRNV
jgi:hypothetical protein